MECKHSNSVCPSATSGNDASRHVLSWNSHYCIRCGNVLGDHHCACSAASFPTTELCPGQAHCKEQDREPLKVLRNVSLHTLTHSYYAGSRAMSFLGWDSLPSPNM